MTVRMLPYGDRAVLFELDSADGVLSTRDRFVAAAVPGVGSVVPAARTVLVEYDPAAVSPETLLGIAESPRSSATVYTRSAEPVVIAVDYDGDDLAAVAEEIGESVESVIALHSDPVYRVQFCGFSPGFAYLVGLDPRLHLSRLASPRPSVPPGSVAIAGEYTGVYPRSSPGGWRLLGRTQTTLFDLSRDVPALLTPGTSVRFVPVR